MITKTELLNALFVWAASPESGLPPEPAATVLAKLQEFAKASDPTRPLSIEQRLQYARLQESKKYIPGV